MNQPWIFSTAGMVILAMTSCVTGREVWTDTSVFPLGSSPTLSQSPEEPEVVPSELPATSITGRPSPVQGEKNTAKQPSAAPGLRISEQPSAAPGHDYAIEDLDPLAKPSFYSGKLPQLLRHWPPATLSLVGEDRDLVRAIKTPGNKDLVGMVKHFEVEAPLAKVIDVNERFEEYPRIWDDVLSVQVQSRDRNRVVTAWTRKAPAFFLSKIRFRMTTVFDKTVMGRVVYRHQLIDGNMVHSSDSLVVYEKVSESRTRVSVFNFFNPDVGPFRALAEGKIWLASLRAGFKEDVAFRARVEHPEWDASQISKEAERVLDLKPIDKVEYTDLVGFD